MSSCESFLKNFIACSDLCHTHNSKPWPHINKPLLEPHNTQDAEFSKYCPVVGYNRSTCISWHGIVYSFSAQPVSFFNFTFYRPDNLFLSGAYQHTVV